MTLPYSTSVYSLHAASNRGLTPKARSVVLAFLHTQLDLTTVMGQRSVCYNPAFPHYVSPDPMDQLLGGSQRPHGRALLLLGWL